MAIPTNTPWGTSLPESPSVENLKKQAKSILKAFEKGDERTCDVLESLDKFRDQSPEQIRKGELCLREVQHALARNNGFESWKEMLAHIESGAGATTKDEQVIDAILHEALTSGASDIHVGWVEDQLHVRLRVDGALRDAKNQIPDDLKEESMRRIKTLAALDPDVTNRPQHGMARLTVQGKKVFLRISFIPYVTGESVTIRIWDDTSFKLDFSQLAFSDEQAAKVKSWIAKPNGIIIFAGPTGSGKTTTLYGVLSEIDTKQRKIVTAEDPVHRLLDGIDQLQVDAANGLTYGRAIREQMHQDIDVMMVGECIDTEVLSLICNVAVTGHLVVTQMHSDSGAGAMRQLLHMGGDAYTLNRTIIGIVSQRLVRKVCNNCREEYTPKDWEIASLGIPEGSRFHKGKGCDECRGTGYRGRTAVYELFELNDELRSALAKNASGEELSDLARASGITSLRDDGIAKALAGITTINEVIRVCQ